MSFRVRWVFFLLAPLLSVASASARQENHEAQSSKEDVHLDVVVTSKSGAPVPGLEQQDFTVFDNKFPQAVASFREVNGRQAPVEVVILMDTANPAYSTVAIERTEIGKFLREDEGRLPYPTALAALGDKGVQILDTFSSDGNALANALDQYGASLRTVTRSQGFWGATERLDISLQGLSRLAAHLAPQPGRKVILIVSPGWPILSGPNVRLSPKDRQNSFENIVNLSTQFQQARVTLYSIDPLGATGVGLRNVYWKDFSKGIGKPSQAEPGNLTLQVLAYQSGGLVLNSSNDVANLMQQCVADVGAYYELSFKSSPAARPDEYHQIEVRVDKPGLTTRTRQGYYSQP